MKKIISKNRLPGFTAEASLVTSYKSHHADSFREYSSQLIILPQMQRVICSISGGRMHCGVEDDTAGISFSLF